MVSTETLEWVLVQIVADILHRVDAVEEVTMGSILNSSQWATAKGPTSELRASRVVLRTHLHPTLLDNRLPPLIQTRLTKQAGAPL